MVDLSMYSPAGLTEYAQDVGWLQAREWLRQQRGQAVLYLESYDRSVDEIAAPVVPGPATLAQHVAEVKAKLAAIDEALDWIEQDATQTQEVTR